MVSSSGRCAGQFRRRQKTLPLPRGKARARRCSEEQGWLDTPAADWLAVAQTASAGPGRPSTGTHLASSSRAACVVRGRASPLLEAVSSGVKPAAGSAWCAATSSELLPGGTASVAGVLVRPGATAVTAMPLLPRPDRKRPCHADQARLSTRCRRVCGGPGGTPVGVGTTMKINAAESPRSHITGNEGPGGEASQAPTRR